MEKRIGSVLLKAEQKCDTNLINSILSDFSSIIISRQGIPLKEKGFSVISVVVESTTDELGALTGKLGKIPFLQVKSILLKN